MRNLKELLTHYLSHNIDPANATFISDLLLRYRRQITLSKKAGEFNDNRLIEIQRDKETQAKFLNLIQQELRGGGRALKAASEIEGLPVDIQAGYFKLKRRLLV